MIFSNSGCRVGSPFPQKLSHRAFPLPRAWIVNEILTPPLPYRTKAIRSSPPLAHYNRIRNTHNRMNTTYRPPSRLTPSDIPNRRLCMGPNMISWNNTVCIVLPFTVTNIMKAGAEANVNLISESTYVDYIPYSIKTKFINYCSIFNGNLTQFFISLSIINIVFITIINLFPI